MIKSKGFLDFENKSSLVRTLFDKEIDLRQVEISPLKISGRFKDLSFVPGKKGFDLIKYMDKLKNCLRSYQISEFNFDGIVPGVSEALKNAYKHGNGKDNNKTIYWHQSFSNKNELEFFIGDEGGIIDGNLFSYALNLLTKSGAHQIEKVPNFYAFCGRGYAPLEHSGIGTKVMNQCFERIDYFKNNEGGLTVYLGKKL